MTLHNVGGRGGLASTINTANKEQLLLQKYSHKHFDLNVNPFNKLIYYFYWQNWYLLPVIAVHLRRNKYKSWGHVSTTILRPESSSERQSVKSRYCKWSSLRNGNVELVAPLVVGFGVGGGWWTLMVEIIWHPEIEKIDLKSFYSEWCV